MFKTRQILILVIIIKILSSVRSLCYERSDVVEGNAFIIGVFPASNGSFTDDSHQNIFPKVLSKYINETKKQNKQMEYNLNIGYAIYYHTQCLNNSNNTNNGTKLLTGEILQLSSNSSKLNENNTIAMFVSGLDKNEIMDQNNTLTFPIFILRESVSSLSHPPYNMTSLTANTYFIIPQIVQEIELFINMLKNFKIENIIIISTNTFYDKIVEELFLPMLIENKRCFHFVRFNNQTIIRFRSFMRKNHSTYTFLLGDNTEQINNILDLKVRTIFIGNQAWTDSLDRINAQNITSLLRILRTRKVTRLSPIATKITKEILSSEENLQGKELLQPYLNTIDFVVESLRKSINLTFVQNKTNGSTNQEITHQTHLLINHNLTSSLIPKQITLITINKTSFQEDHYYSLSKTTFTKKPIQTSVKDSCSKRICKFNYKNVYQPKTLNDNDFISYAYSCQKCRNTDNNISSCRRHYEHVPYHTSLAYIVYTIMGIGMLTTTIVCIIFLVYKETPYVKASHQVMSLVQLFAHFILFLAPAMFIGKPSQTLCSARPITFGILFTFIMAMIVTKTQKLNFIFHSRLRVSKRQVQMSKKMEISLILLMMVIEFCIAGLSYFMSPSRILTVYNKEIQSYIIKCNTDEEVMIQMAFGFLLEIMCMIQAFKAKNLPENFNETKHIFIAMILCIMTEAIGLLLRYYVIKKNINKALIDVLILLVMNCILLGIMYGRKCFVIIFRPHLNTPSAFKQNLQLHNLKGMVSDHVTMSHRDSTFSGITTISSPSAIRTAVFSADNMAYKH